MKRPPDGDDGKSYSSAGDGDDSKLAGMIANFLRRHPRIFFQVGVGFAVAVVVAFLLMKFAN